MPADPADELLPATENLPALRIRRSARRRKTVSARWEDGALLLMVPARTTREQARGYARKLLPGVRAARDAAGTPDPRATDAYLAERARQVAAAWLDETVAPVSIRWVTNQNTRWGSATPSRGTIRISHQLRGAPEYVLDYVLHHELCHLVEPSHNGRFRRLEARYPHLDRARAFLDGMVFARGRETPGAPETGEPGADATDADGF